MTDQINKSGGVPESEVSDKVEYKAAVTFTNNWGSDIRNVTVRIGANETKTFPMILDGKTTEPWDVKHYGGLRHDYWWVKFSTPNGEIWSCKDGFYCSFGKQDKSASLSVSGPAKRMYIKFDVSSGCDAPLKKA